MDGSLSPPIPVGQSLFAIPWPNGEFILNSDLDGAAVVRCDTGQTAQFPKLHGVPVGLWPDAPTGWSGHRCLFNWLYKRDSRFCYLSACEHDWPCGHAKKQYGFLDNEPCWIHLSRSRDAYLSVYQKDAIVSQAVPVRWRACGGGWAAVSKPADDPYRALFFCHEEFPADPEVLEEEDARDVRPAIVLGPDSEHRYALDLSLPVYRLSADRTDLVHQAHPGYGIYSRDHKLQRTGNGRLLGGWDRHLVILQEGRLRREDMVDGTKTDLGPETSSISFAFSLPATPNVVLVWESGRELKVRLV